MPLFWRRWYVRGYSLERVLLMSWAALRGQGRTQRQHRRARDLPLSGLGHGSVLMGWLRFHVVATTSGSL